MTAQSSNTSYSSKMAGGVLSFSYENKFSEQNLSMDLKESLQEAKRARQEYDKKLDKWFMDFRDMKPIRLIPFVGSANWSVPISSTATFSIVPRMIEGTFGFDPPIIYKPVDIDSEFISKPYNKFMGWFNKRKNLEDKVFYPLFLNTAWSGTGYAYVYMKMEKETREIVYDGYTAYGIEDKPVMHPDDLNAVLMVTPENTRKYFEEPVDPNTSEPVPPIPYKIKTFKYKKRVWKNYEPDVKIIETKNIYFPSDCTSIQDAWENSWIFIREYVTKDYLKRMIQQSNKELYKNLNKIKIEGLETKVETIPDQEAARKNWLIEYAEKTNRVEVWRCLGNADIDNDGINEKIVVLMDNEGVMFGREKYPYKHKRCPIVEAKIMPLNDKPFGIGFPERLYDTKGFLDDFYSSTTDRIKFQNDPPIMYTRKSGYSPMKHKKGYGRNWLLNDTSPDNIRSFELPRSEFNTFQLIQSYQRWGDRITSVDARSQGVEDPGSKNLTKGGIEAVIAEGNILFRQYVRNLTSAVEDIYFQIASLLKQYWGEEADEEVNEWVRQVMDIPDNPLRTEMQTEAFTSRGVTKYDAINYSFNVEIVAKQRDREKEIQRGFQTYEVVKAETLYESDPERKIAALKSVYISMGYTEQEAESIIPRLDEVINYQVKIQKQALAELQDEQMKSDAEADAERELE